MFKSVTVENFKMFDKFTIGDLSYVNLIVGKNRVGKSTLLEAISLVASPKGENLSNVFKGYRGEIPLNMRNFRVTSVDKENKTTILEVITDDLSDFLTKGVSYDCYLDNLRKEIFSKVFVQYPNRLFDFVQYSDSSTLKGLDLISFCEYLIPVRSISIGKLLFYPYCYTDLIPKEDRLLFSNLLNKFKSKNNEFLYESTDKKSSLGYDTLNGLSYRYLSTEIDKVDSGFSYIFKLLIMLVTTKNGILFLDNFGSDLHYSVLPEVWNVIFFLAKKFNIQVFAVTQSKDAIESFSEVWKQNEDYGSFYRIFNSIRENSYGKPVVRSYDCETLSDSIETNTDVR